MPKIRLNFVDLLLLGLCLLFAERLLFQGSVVRESVAAALSLCVETLIPSLFCFMVLTAFLSGTGFGKLLALPLLPLTRFLCLPPSCGAILLMSLVGGYPVGAKALKEAYERQEINEAQLKRMILFCVCPAPSFVIVAIGSHLFHNQTAGFILYGSQVLGLLFIGLLTSLTAEQSSRMELCHFLQRNIKTSYSTALVDAVNFAAQTMLSMCGYVVLCAVISALIAQQTLPSECLPLMSAFLEITNGTMQLAKLSHPYRLSILSFFLSFGGMAVLLQLKNILKEQPLSFPRIFCGRILHGCLSAVFTTVLLQCFPQALQVFHSGSQPVPLADSSTPFLTGCLIAMIVIFMSNLESIPAKIQKKENK